MPFLVGLPNRIQAHSSVIRVADPKSALSEQGGTWALIGAAGGASGTGTAQSSSPGVLSMKLDISLRLWRTARNSPKQGKCSPACQHVTPTANSRSNAGGRPTRLMTSGTGLPSGTWQRYTPARLWRRKSVQMNLLHVSVTRIFGRSTWIAQPVIVAISTSAVVKREASRRSRVSVRSGLTISATRSAGPAYASDQLQNRRAPRRSLRMISTLV